MNRAVWAVCEVATDSTRLVVSLCIIRTSGTRTATSCTYAGVLQQGFLALQGLLLAACRPLCLLTGG
jgi:hypothetical protein